MGNKNGATSFKDGSVLITLDNQHYMAGQQITGTVTVLLDKPFPAEKLTIQLQGKERYMWEGRDDLSMNKKHSGMICVKNTLLKMQVVLKTYPDGVAT